MKLKHLFYLILFINTILLSCGKKDGLDNQITDLSNTYQIKAQNINNNSNLVTKAKSIFTTGNGINWQETILGVANISNNSFTLGLPLNPSETYLKKFWGNDADYIGLTTSDKEAKLMFFSEISGYNNNNNEIGYYFQEVKKNSTIYYKFWVYTDRDVTITGSVDWGGTKNYNLDLKKGWNEYHWSHSDILESYSSTAPNNGTDPVWYFIGNNINSTSSSNSNNNIDIKNIISQQGKHPINTAN